MEFFMGKNMQNTVNSILDKLIKIFPILKTRLKGEIHSRM
jgi:hypothetical protein